MVSYPRASIPDTISGSGNFQHSKSCSWKALMLDSEWYWYDLDVGREYLK